MWGMEGACLKLGSGATERRSRPFTRLGALLPGGLGRLQAGLKKRLYKRVCQNELMGLFVAARLGPMVILGYKDRSKWT